MKKSQNNSNLRNHTLDFLKGICIILVVITHYSWNDTQRVKFLFPFWIDIAVPIFMLITGYVYSLSYNKSSSSSLRVIYTPKSIIIKILRYTIPFVPVFIAEVVLHIIFKGERHTIIQLVKDFVMGGYGPGSYYYPVMIQVVFIMPLIWYVINRYKEKGLIITFIVNLIFEIVKNMIGLSDGLYRLLVFRYIFALSLGCYSYYSPKINIKYFIISTIIGLSYLIVFNYTGLQPLIMTKWTNTSMIAVMFIYPLTKWLISKNLLKNSIIELLGKASFNIFLAQMAYYYVGDGIIFRTISSPFLQIVANIVICCSTGLVFYFIETPITKNIVKSIKK